MPYFNKCSIKLLLAIAFIMTSPIALSETVVDIVLVGNIKTTTTTTTTTTPIPNTELNTTTVVTDTLVEQCTDGCFFISFTTNTETFLTTGSDNPIDIIEANKPTQVAAQGATAISFGGQQLQILHNRITSLKPGKDRRNRFSFSGFTMMDSFGQPIAIGQMLENMLYNALDDGVGEDPFRDSRLGGFVRGQLSRGDKDTTNAESGFDIDLRSITFGLDYQLTDELTLGIATGYGQSNVDFDSNGGDMDNDTKSISAYASYFLPNDFYVDGVVNYATNDFENTRNIAYQTFQTSAKSDTSGDQYGISLGIGKDFYVDSFSINPYVRTEYLAVNIDSYTEQGGAGFALHVDKQDISSLTSTVGGQVSRAFSMPWGIVMPGMRLEWQHQYRNDQRTISGQFVESLPGFGNFAINTENPDRNYFNLEASVAVTLPYGQAAYLRYETRLGQDDITNHTIEALVRMQF